MYNRYINPKGFFEMQEQHEPSPPLDVSADANDDLFCEVCAEEPGEDGAPASSEPAKAGKGLFGGSFKLPDFNADTILMLVLVYFLISDELTPSSKEDGEKDKKNITDTMLIIGALLLLGF